MSRYPTLTWYNFNDSSPFTEVELYEYQPDGKLKQVFLDAVDVESSGYASYTFPETEVGLTVGQTYLWRVVDYCDEFFEEINVQITANFTVVEDDPPLATGTSPATIARTYAENGVWYDAMALVYTATDPESVALRQELLTDLVMIEQEFFQEKQELLNDRQRHAIATNIRRLEDISQME